MTTSHSPFADEDPRPPDTTGFWRPLLHRWFVEFNPLYLLSAALVLTGCFLLSRGLVSQENLGASLGITLVSEVYAVSLLGGAALLTRVGQSRPAVMLALLFVLYQWDLTLHTETCAYLGSIGIGAAVAWLALFLGKMYGLAWALRVRLARRVVVAAAVAAVGLAVGPRVIPELGARNAGALLAVWVFALGALFRSSGEITSLVELTSWGQTVLRRVARAAWALSGVLVSVHVLLWLRDHEIAISTVLPVAPLLFVRRVRSEARMWAIVLGTLAAVGLVLPGAFSVTALLVAAALVLRALSPKFAGALEASPPEGAPEQPYRVSRAWAHEPEETPSIERAPIVEAAERLRSFAGASFALYLSAWTLHWSGGPWPAHVVALDVALVVAVLLAVWRFRVRLALVPLAAGCVHFIVQSHLVPAPRTSVEWGATAVTLGFALLGLSLATSYWLRARPEGRGEARSG